MIGLLIVELVFTAGAEVLFAYGILLTAAFLLLIAWGAWLIAWWLKYGQSLGRPPQCARAPSESSSRIAPIPLLGEAGALVMQALARLP